MGSKIIKKPKVVVLFFSLLVFIISIVVLIAASKGTFAEINSEEGIYNYSIAENKRFLYFEIKIDHIDGTVIWRDNFSMYPPNVFLAERAEILILDENGAQIAKTSNDNGIEIARCFTREFTISISEPFLCNIYTIDIIIHRFTLINAIMISLAIISVLTLFVMIILTYFVKVKGSDEESKVKKLPIEEEIKYNFIKIKGKPIGKAICAISKTKLDETDEILRCPHCNSYFIEKYLMGWLEKSSKCPICQSNLKYRERD